jgi:stress-induced morphogen
MEDAIRTKVCFNTMIPNEKLYRLLIDSCGTAQRSSEANFDGNLQRLSQARSSPGHEGQHISRNAFPVGSRSNVSLHNLGPLTSYSVFVTSEEFKSKMQPARHRMVYGLLKDEMAAEGGIHALQLRTRTPDEEAKAKAKESS